MVVIRLTRVGKRGVRQFRVAVSEKRSKRDGDPIEILGWITKTETGVKKEIKDERLKYWLSKGAKPSDTVSKLLNL